MPISVQSGTAVNAPYLTEDHGVPGSNPDPATLKSPAKLKKIRSSRSAAGALCQRRVNSRIKKRSLLAPLWRSPACLLWCRCRYGEGHPVTVRKPKPEALRTTLARPPASAGSVPWCVLIFALVRPAPSRGVWCELSLPAPGIAIQAKTFRVEGGKSPFSLLPESRRRITGVFLTW